MKDESQLQIGKRIKLARVEKGLSQEQLGQKIGYSAMGVSHIENGERKLKIEDLQKIAKELAIEVSYFLEPITKLSYPTANYRRGAEEITDEQKKAEQDALKKLDDLVKNMES